MDELPLPDEDDDEVLPTLEALGAPVLPLAKPPSPSLLQDRSPTRVGGDMLPPVEEGTPLLSLESDGGGETFAVYLLGFLRGRDEAAGKLSELFGLDAHTAESLVASAPVSVKRGASRETAFGMERALRAIGADVDVRPESPPKRARQPSVRPMDKARAAIDSQNALAASSGFPPQLAEGAPMVPGLPTEGGEHPGFWVRLPTAFLVPFLGSGGVMWLIGLSVVLLGTGFIRLAPCIGLLVMPIAGAFYLGLLGTYFGQAAQVGLDDEGGGLPQPHWHSPNRDDVLRRGMVLVVLTILLFGIPAVLAFRGASPYVAMAAGLLPYIYWPMALTVVGLTGSMMSLFNPLHIIKGIIAGGLPYLVVVVIGFVLNTAMTALPLLLMAVGPGAALLGALVVLAGVGYVAGVQGYLMGCVVGSRSERFEGLIG